MNRCKPHLLSALLVLAASSATAQDFKPAVRQFPPAALRGEMVVVAPPDITLDGKADRLSPGSRIRGTDNLLVMSGALVNQKVVVNYLRERAGNVHEVWILNAEEARLKRPNSKKSWFDFFGAGSDPAPVDSGESR